MKGLCFLLLCHLIFLQRRISKHFAKLYKFLVLFFMLKNRLHAMIMKTKHIKFISVKNSKITRENKDLEEAGSAFRIQPIEPPEQPSQVEYFTASLQLCCYTVWCPFPCVEDIMSFGKESIWMEKRELLSHRDELLTHRETLRLLQRLVGHSAAKYSLQHGNTQDKFMCS